MVTVAIPTIGESPYLRPLVESLLEDPAVSLVILMVNRKHVELDEPPSTRVMRLNYEGSIYHGWNMAISYAKLLDDPHLAILNDDIELPFPKSIGWGSHVIDETGLTALGFDYTGRELPPPPTAIMFAVYECRGTYRHGGIPGFAFMVDASRCPLVDEQFEWWGGDDDLMFQIERAGGKMGVATGLPVVHHSGTTAAGQSWIGEAIGRDRERLIAKYGEGAAW